MNGLGEITVVVCVDSVIGAVRYFVDISEITVVVCVDSVIGAVRYFVDISEITRSLYTRLTRTVRLGVSYLVAFGRFPNFRSG